MRKIKTEKYGFRLSVAFFLCCLLLSGFFATGCGKKGDPTLKSFEKPDAPLKLAAVRRDRETILRWDFPQKKETEIKGFIILRSKINAVPPEKDGRTDFEKIAVTDNKSRTCSDSIFTEGTAYKYKAVSQNLRGIVSRDSNIIEVKAVKLPEPPSMLSFRIDFDTFTLKWKETASDMSYNIYKSSTKGDITSPPVNKEPVKGNFHKDVFDINRPVYYFVRAFSGNEVRYESSPSEEIYINPAELMPSQPLNLQAAALAGSVVLLWKEPAETYVSGYRVYREVDRKKGFILVGETKVPSFTDNEKAATKRNYRVAAVGPVKEGPAAEIRNIIYVKPK